MIRIRKYGNQTLKTEPPRRTSALTKAQRTSMSLPQAHEVTTHKNRNPHQIPPANITLTCDFQTLNGERKKSVIHKYPPHNISMVFCYSNKNRLESKIKDKTIQTYKQTNKSTGNSQNLRTTLSVREKCNINLTSPYLC